MTKRDFESIARAINIEQAQYPAGSTEWDVVRDVTLQLCIYFHAANVRFRQDVFMAACGF